MKSILQTLAGWLTNRTPKSSSRKPHTKLAVEMLEDRQLPSASIVGAWPIKPWDGPLASKSAAASENSPTHSFAVSHDAKSVESAVKALDIAGVQKSRVTAEKMREPTDSNTKSDATDKKSSHPVAGTKSDATDKKSSDTNVTKSSDATDKKSNDATDKKSSDTNEKKSSHATDKKSGDTNEKKSSHATDKKSSDTNEKKSSDATDKKSSGASDKKSSEVTDKKSSQHADGASNSDATEKKASHLPTGDEKIGAAKTVKKAN